MTVKVYHTQSEFVNIELYFGFCIWTSFFFFCLSLFDWCFRAVLFDFFFIVLPVFQSFLTFSIKNIGSV